MITWQTGNIKTHVAISTFKGGEVNVNINRGSLPPVDASVGRVWVCASLNKPEHVMALVLTMDALRRAFPLAQFVLDMPYLPYARQDRICNPGEAHALKAFAAIINSLGFCSVWVADPHSDVAAGVINNLEVTSQLEIFGKLHNFAEWIIVAPDLGALKKANAFAAYVGAAGVVYCYKERNLATGELIKQYINGFYDFDQMMGKKLFVLDDICDGGRTFAGVYSLLNDFTPERVELAVTHGIFSYGQEVVTDLYDMVHTTNSWNPELVGNEKLNVLNVY